MARRRKKGGSRKKGIRIGATVGIAVGLYTLWKAVQAAPTANKGAAAIHRLTGYDINAKVWKWQDATALMPMVGGIGVSMIASKVGLNRYTPRGINI